MATFGQTSYSAVRYASIRPTYPEELFKAVFSYHERLRVGARWGTAVDLGCGTGQVTRQLLPFSRIVGVDPSEKMLEQARGVPKLDAMRGELEFFKSPAEHLPFLEDGSADLIVSAQAAHWFDWPKLWREASRVLRQHGTLAAWGYSEFRLTDYPSATPLINEYSQGEDPNNSLGQYWERPGRTILDNHLLAIPPPDDVVPGHFCDFERIFFRGGHHDYLPAHQSRPVILQKTVTWAGLLSYLYTFSSLHTYHQCHPDDRTRSEGDIAVRFLKKLKVHVEEQSGHVLKETDEINIEWPVALILARRS